MPGSQEGVVFEQVYDEVLEKLEAKIVRLVVGPDTERGVLIGPMHTPAQRAEIEAQVDDALSRGATLRAGGARPQGKAWEQGNYYLPTLLTSAPHDSRVATTEVFGPVLTVWPVRDIEEAIERANSLIYGPGSFIWTRDLNRAMHAAERLEAGYTWINIPSRIYDELPFGGLKQSGMGKEHGSEALDYYMETKAVVVGQQ